MKKMIKQISSCLLMVSFILLLGESGFMVHSHPIVFCQEVYDINNTVETSHTHGLEDHFFCNDSRSKSNQKLKPVDFIPALNIDPENGYISNIWQPPQFS